MTNNAEFLRQAGWTLRDGKWFNPDLNNQERATFLDCDLQYYAPKELLRRLTGVARVDGYNEAHESWVKDFNEKLNNIRSPSWPVK